MRRVTTPIILLVGLPTLATAQVTEVDTSGIEGRFNLMTNPDAVWQLRLKKNQTYECVYWNGWSGDTAYAAGTYQLVHSRLKFTVKRRPVVGGPYADSPTFKGVRCYVYRIPRNLSLRQHGTLYERRPYDGKDERYVLSSKKIRTDKYSPKKESE